MIPAISGSLVLAHVDGHRAGQLWTVEHIDPQATAGVADQHTAREPDGQPAGRAAPHHRMRPAHHMGSVMRSRNGCPCGAGRVGGW